MGTSWFRIIVKGDWAGREDQEIYQVWGRNLTSPGLPYSESPQNKAEYYIHHFSGCLHQYYKLELLEILRKAALYNEYTEF